MENERLVALETLCNCYKVDTSFIQSLNEYGLLEITRTGQTECVDKDCLAEVETMINLHYELEINMEGIDAISHLLKRVKEMQKEISILKTRLGLVSE